MLSQNYVDHVDRSEFNVHTTWFCPTRSVDIDIDSLIHFSLGQSRICLCWSLIAYRPQLHRHFVGRQNVLNHSRKSLQTKDEIVSNNFLLNFWTQHKILLLWAEAIEKHREVRANLFQGSNRPIYFTQFNRDIMFFYFKKWTHFNFYDYNKSPFGQGMFLMSS